MSKLNSRLNSSVLVIDDDLDLLMLLERILTKEGYIVETAASIAEAEDILSVFTPGITLLDININGEDGRKLCWKLKKQEPQSNTKVIIMSGYDFSLGRAVLFGADDLLPKPLNIEFLLHKLAGLMQEVDAPPGDF
ncbi:MAG: response regulator [Candidatus Dadabacteria bacterium]